MRMITTAIAALGFAGAMAIGTPSATLAQGLYFQGPGVEFGIGRPAYRGAITATTTMTSPLRTPTEGRTTVARMWSNATTAIATIGIDPRIVSVGVLLHRSRMSGAALLGHLKS